MFCQSRRPFFTALWLAALIALLGACAPAAPPAPTPPSAPKPAPTAAAPKPAPVATQPAAPAAPAAATAPAAAKPAATAAPAAKPVAKPSGPAEWIVATAEEAPTLDPAWTSTLPGRTAQMHIFDGLVGFEGKSFNPMPLLAESWTRTDDRTWLFKIRKGVKVHNGDDFTAADVKYSLDLYRTDKSQNKTYLTEVTSVEQVDQYTIKITTRGPNPSMLPNIAFVLMMPLAREKMGEEAFAKNPVGTGAYRFVEFVRGQRLVLEANPNYWRGQAHPRKLTMRTIADPSTRVAELKTGGVHVIAAPPPARFKDLDSGDTKLVPLKAARLIIHPINSKEKPFDDVRVRQALNYAVDRDSIIKNVLEGYGEPLHGPFATPWLGYDPNLKPYAYDPAKAKQLLTEAGYPNGIETTWSISSGAFLRDREIAEAVAKQLAAVGIKVQLIPTERAKLIEDWNNGVYKGITSAAWGTSADPDPMLGRAFYKSKGFKPDEKRDGLIEQSRRTVDLEERKKILQEFGRYAQDQAMWFFIHAQHDYFATRKDILWEPYPLNGSFANTQYYDIVGR